MNKGTCSDISKGILKALLIETFVDIATVSQFTKNSTVFASILEKYGFICDIFI